MTIRRALVIGHDHVAGLGLLEAALHSHDIELGWRTVVSADRFDAPDADVAFPDPQPWDLIITLGAPWPRERIRTWAATETAFLRHAHEAGVPILAICFGAQLLAEALGGTTRPLGRSRIGWHDIHPATGSNIPTGPWFCWNSEQIVPPHDATVLATSDDGCEAYRLGSSVGLQFHPEMSSHLLTRWLSLGAPDGIDIAHLREATTQHEQRTASAVQQLLQAVLELPRHSSTDTYSFHREAGFVRHPRSRLSHET